MKKNIKCLNCGSNESENIENLNLCYECEKKLFEKLLKRNTPKAIKSMFLQNK